MLKRNWYDVAWELTRDDGHILHTSVRHICACDEQAAFDMFYTWYTECKNRDGSMNILGSTFTFENIRILGLTDLQGNPFPSSGCIDIHLKKDYTYHG